MQPVRTQTHTTWQLEPSAVQALFCTAVALVALAIFTHLASAGHPEAWRAWRAYAAVSVPLLALTTCAIFSPKK